MAGAALRAEQALSLGSKTGTCSLTPRSAPGRPLAKGCISGPAWTCGAQVSAAPRQGVQLPRENRTGAEPLSCCVGGRPDPRPLCPVSAVSHGRLLQSAALRGQRQCSAPCPLRWRKVDWRGSDPAVPGELLRGETEAGQPSWSGPLPPASCSGDSWPVASTVGAVTPPPPAALRWALCHSFTICSRRPPCAPSCSSCPWPTQSPERSCFLLLVLRRGPAPLLIPALSLGQQR